jgi:hypothetical protein
LRFDFDATCLDSSPSYLQTFIGYAIIAAASRFLEFVVVCILILMPLASIQALLTFQLLLAIAINAAARRFLDFVIACLVGLMICLQSYYDTTCLLSCPSHLPTFIGHEIVVAARKCPFLLLYVFLV